MVQPLRQDKNLKSARWALPRRDFELVRDKDRMRFLDGVKRILGALLQPHQYYYEWLTLEKDMLHDTWDLGMSFYSDDIKLDADISKYISRYVDEYPFKEPDNPSLFESLPPRNHHHDETIGEAAVTLGLEPELHINQGALRAATQAAGLNQNSMEARVLIVAYLTHMLKDKSLGVHIRHSTVLKAPAILLSNEGE